MPIHSGHPGHTIENFDFLCKSSKRFLAQIHTNWEFHESHFNHVGTWGKLEKLGNAVLAYVLLLLKLINVPQRITFDSIHRNEVLPRRSLQIPAFSVILLFMHGSLAIGPRDNSAAMAGVSGPIPVLQALEKAD